MPKTKAPKPRPRSPSGSPTPRARQSRGDVPPSPATPSTRTSTRVPKATNLAMDFIKTTAARRATAAAEADALAAEADASAVDMSSSASTTTRVAATKDASGLSHDASASVKNAFNTVKNALTSVKKVSASIKNASAPTKDALASKRTSSAANGRKKSSTSSKKPSTVEDVSTLSVVHGLAADNIVEKQGPEATNGMRLRSRDKPAAPAANQKLPKPSKKSRVAKDVQDETSSIPTTNHPDRPTTPVTAVRVRGEDGDAVVEAPAPVKRKPKPRAVRREHDTTATVPQQDIPVQDLDQRGAGEPDVSDSGTHAGGSNSGLREAPEVRGGQVTVAGSGVDCSPVAAHSALTIGLNAAELTSELRPEGMAAVPLGMTDDVRPSGVVPGESSSLREAALARHGDSRELASGAARVEPDIPADRPADVPHPGMRHVQQLDPRQVWQGNMPNVGWEVRPHVWHGDPQNRPDDLLPNVPPHAWRGDPQILRHDVPPDVPPDVMQQVPPDVLQQVPPHLPYDVPPQRPPNIHPNIPHNVEQDVRHGIPSFVRNAFPHDIQPGIAANIPPQVPLELPPHAHSGLRVQAAAGGAYPAHHAVPTQNPEMGSSAGVSHHTHLGMPPDGVAALPCPREDHTPAPWRLPQAALHFQGGEASTPQDIQVQQRSSYAHPMHMRQKAETLVVAQVPPEAVPDRQANIRMNVSPGGRTHPMEVNADSDAVVAHDATPEAFEQSHMSRTKVHGSVSEYAPAEIRDNVSTNVPNDARGDHVRDNVHADVRDPVSMAVHSHVHTDARPDVRDHVHADVRNYIHTDVRMDVRDNIHTDVRSYVRTDTRPDVRDNIHTDVRNHVRTDTRPDVRDNVHTDVRTHVHADARPDVRDNGHTDVREHVPMNVHMDFPDNVPSDVHANVTDNVPMGDSAEEHTQLHTEAAAKTVSEKGKSRKEHTSRPRKAQEATAAVKEKRGSHSTAAPDDSADENLSEAAYDSGDGEDEDEGDGNGDGDGDVNDNANTNSDGDGDGGDDDDDDEVDDSDSDTERDAIFGDTKAVGRISKANKEIIKASFDDVINVARKASELTGLSVGQVYDQWNVKRTRHNVKNNAWNSYQSYHRANLAQERARLPKAVLKRKKESDIPSLCYKEFKKKYGKKAYDILESWRQLQELSGAANTTVARRKQDWNSWCTDMQQKAKVGHLKHGFSCVIVAVGNVINSDSSLAMIHASKDAQGFFPTRFRCDDDTAIGHMKALVYNNVSLAVVEMSQNDDAGPSNPMSLTPLAGPVGPKSVNVAQDLFIAILQTLKLPNSRGRSQFLVSCMRSLLRVLGPQGAVLADISNFQWKKFGAMLAAQGIQMIGYPERVPMPPAAAPDDDEKPARSKGLSGIGATPSQLFMDAFLKPHKTHPIGFQLYSGLRTDLLNSKVPVIIGVPPHPASEFTHGRRFFMNGVTDRAGLKRRLPSADDSDEEAPVPSKKRRAAAPDSDDSDDEAPVSKKRCAAPPDSGDEADEEEVERGHKTATKCASPRRTRSKTDQAKPPQSKTVHHAKTDNAQPGHSKTVDQAKVAKIAKAAGITLRTVAVEIPDTPSTPIARQRTTKGEDVMTLSSGTGSRYTPSRSATPGPSQSHGGLKRKADALESAEEESVSETLSDILAAAATISKGKQRADDVGARAFQTSDDEDAVASSSLSALEDVRENWHEDSNTADDGAMLRSPPLKQRRLDPGLTIADAGSRSGGILAPDHQLTLQSAVHADIRTDVGQSLRQASHADVPADVEQHVRQASHMDIPANMPANVGQRVPQASHADVPTEMGLHVGHRVVAAGRPDVPTNAGQQGRPEVPPHVGTDVGQHVRPEVPPHVGTDVGQHVRHANPPYGGWDVGPHVQSAGNPNARPNAQPHHPDIGTNAPPESMPPFPPNLRHAPPSSLPPFPPNLRPHPIPHSSIHVNHQVPGGPPGGIHSPEAQQVPVNHPQDNRQVGVAPHGGASSDVGAPYGAYTQAPYGPPLGSYPPHPGYSNHRYMNAAAYQYSNGGGPGGFHPAMLAGLPYQQQYFQPPPMPPPGSSMSTSPPPTYWPVQSVTPGAYPQHPGSQHANTAPGASHQYHEGRHAQTSSTAAQPAAFGDTPRAG